MLLLTTVAAATPKDETLGLSEQVFVQTDSPS